MDTPTPPEPPDRLTRFDHLPPLDALVAVWKGDRLRGDWPHVQQRVRAAMPALARALDRAAARAHRFVCPRCGAASYDPEDRRQGYCGRCYDFTGTPGERPVPWRAEGDGQ